MANGTQFPDTGVPDAPTVIDASWRFTNTERSKIDAQILGTQGVVAGINTTITKGTVTAKTVRAATPSVVAGQAVMPINGQIQLAQTSALPSALYHAGIVLAAGGPGASLAVVTQGFVDPAIVNLGAGLACAVGTDASGNPVRVTDPACVSGLKFLGVCDANGAIYVSPRRAASINVQDFGAVGDGITDSTSSIQAAVTFAKAQSPVNGQFAGIRIYFPAGVYLCSSQINFDSTAVDITHDWPNTTLCGDGGGIVATASNHGASTLIYTGTGSTPFISAKSTAYFSISDMAVLYQSSSFTGNLVDLSHSSLGSDTTSPTFRGCLFGCDQAAHTSAASLISTGASELVVVDTCGISGGAKGIDLCGSVVQATIKNTQFSLCTDGAIFNPSLNTIVDGCTFESLTKAVASDIGTPYAIIGFVFRANWCGDTNDITSAWIDPGNGEFQGAIFSGNTFSNVPDGGNHSLSQKDSIKLGSCRGVTIFGNYMCTVDFSAGDPGSDPQGIVIFSNYLNGGNTTGAPYWRNQTVDRIATLFANIPVGFDQGALDQIGVAGHIVSWPTLGTQPTLTAATNASAAVDGTAFQGSNDTAGRITLTVTGLGTSSGVQCTLTYAFAYDSSGLAPKVILQPENAITAALAASVYVTSAKANFEIQCATTLAAGTYVWSYMVMQ